MTTRCLSVHARYACRHSGACCTAGWPIPIEADRLAALDAARASGTLRGRTSDRPAWTRDRTLPAAASARLAADEHGCVFHHPGAAGRCGIHATLGHAALPLACRQFPRVSVHDPRGVSVTLSHFCPTAAALLDAPGEVTIVADAPAFPPGAELVGLDARTSLPPLVRPGMLTDWESWWEWERRAVAHVAGSTAPPGEAVGQLRSVVEAMRTWSPGDGPLIDGIDRAFREGDLALPPAGDPRGYLAEVLAAVPAGLRPSRLDETVETSAAVARRYLAAHAFASWTAHLGGGLRSWLRSIEAAWSLLTLGLGVRQSDLLLRHLADPDALANVWTRAVDPPRRSPRRVRGRPVSEA